MEERVVELSPIKAHSKQASMISLPPPDSPDRRDMPSIHLSKTKNDAKNQQERFADHELFNVQLMNAEED